MFYTIPETYRLKKMASLAKKYHKVIDVGCAQYPNPYLKNTFVLGLDIQKSILPKNYHDFFNGTIEDFKKEKQQFFEALIAGEIIEHLENPLSFLRTCQQILIPGGSIILSTPNPHSPIEFLLNIFLSRRFFCTSDHIMLFPQRWLIRVLEIAGFVDVKLYSGGFPLPFIGLIPSPRFCCYQTIAKAYRPYLYEDFQ